LKNDFTQRLDATLPDFWDQLATRLAWQDDADQEVISFVNQTIADIRATGDQALLEYTNKFDRLALTSASQLKVSQAQIDSALAGINQERRSALQAAAERIRQYAERQKLDSWSYTEADGTTLGQQVSALDSVGLYVPGGKAAYPSSVLMNAIPAKVAGVARLVMVVPSPDGELDPMVLAAAAIAGVDEIFTIGGAQAIAALAYGTETIPAVDKIVGPGNIYVATAKRMVYGKVGIDNIAGPSEILVYSDGQADPDWIAMDLFSQAEHDELAQAILISSDRQFIDQVEVSMLRLVEQLPRREIIQTSMKNRGLLIDTPGENLALQVINFIAPEHLELSVADPESVASQVRHAGAIFMGRYSSEALGDYCAGPNHVLPTSRTARFSSPLGVYDFQKRSSLINVSEKGATSLGRIATVLAEAEGLDAHARSAAYRVKD